MRLYKLIFTQNDCYKAGEKLKPKGIMVHSTGVNNPNLSRYVGPDDGLLGINKNGNCWNQPKPDGRQVCVHGFIGKLKDGSVAAYQTLPWDMRGWHSGGKANDTHIGFEICEDALVDADYFSKVYKEATELCAYLCGLFSLDPLSDGVLIDHSEGYKRGVASNHSDVGNWFPRFGRSMGTFRADVKTLLAAGSNGTDVKEGLTTMRIRVNGGEIAEIPSILYEGSNYPNLRALASLLGLTVGYEPVGKIVTVDGPHTT